MPAIPTYTDGSYAVAFATSLPVFSAPFADQGITENYILTQKWCQELASFAPAPLDDPHPDYPTYGLVSESEKSDLGGGMVEWTRTYAEVPEEFSRLNGNTTYNFIGFAYTSTTRLARPRQTFPVPMLSTKTFARTTDPLTDLPFIEATTYARADNADSLVDELVEGSQYDASSLTDPTRTEYEVLIAGGTYCIVTEASRISVWMGNIYVRETLYVKAK